jgi:methylase of polypeptide subunit release factors
METQEQQIAERIKQITARVLPPVDDHDINFMGYTLFVKGGVFDPSKGKSARKMARSIELVPPRPQDRVLEIGTGCGVLSVVAHGLVPDILVTAVDIMEPAIESAKVNFAKAGMKADVRLSDLFENVSGYYDYVIFNAPTAHCSVSDDNPAVGVLWDATQTLKHRFMDQVRDYLNPHNPNAKILMMYSIYADFNSLQSISFDGFEKSDLFVEEDALSKSGVLLLTKPRLSI